MTGAWLRKPTTRILWPQGHSSGSTSYTRRISRAHDFKAGRKPGTIGLRRIGRFVLRRHREEDFAPSRDSPVGVRVGAVVVDKMRSPIGDVRGEAGDPLQVVIVPVAGGCPLLSVIRDGSLGKVPHFRFLGRIDAESTGCGRSPDHVESHAQRVLDVGDFVDLVLSVGVGADQGVIPPVSRKPRRRPEIRH